ncbi:Protein EVI2A [Lonchura striata]|uniref:Protein EVI2A n=1 Tax=Lonchura striata TaxID=40157 RepID=A0A218UM89_9PASE|nr:protein EVI2A [Lonchura striata domestica]OWK54718.1 Protein EVI2A [Lonchura striata domestica]
MVVCIRGANICTKKPYCQRTKYLKYPCSVDYVLARGLNSKMQTKRCSNPHLAFPVMIIFSLWLQTGANHTGYPHLREETWSPISQNLSGSQNRTEASTNSPLSLNFSSQTITFEIQSTLPSFSSTMTQNLTSPAPSAVSTTRGLEKSSKPKSPVTKETCEDNKSLILICFIIIAVLVLICISLFLSTVIAANKISYLKRAQQGKRRPRSNGDLLATNSLWPTAAGTWQRMPKETSGTELIMQELISGRDAVNQRKTEDETTEKLTKAVNNEQESKEPSQSHKTILTNFVVEI